MRSRLHDVDVARHGAGDEPGPAVADHDDTSPVGALGAMRHVGRHIARDRRDLDPAPPVSARMVSPLTVSTLWVPSGASSPAIARSPLVVAADTSASLPARTSRSPDTVRARSRSSPVATRATSPDAASMATVPLTRASSMSPDAVRNCCWPDRSSAVRSLLDASTTIVARCGRRTSRSGVPCRPGPVLNWEPLRARIARLPSPASISKPSGSADPCRSSIRTVSPSTPWSRTSPLPSWRTNSPSAPI